MPCRPQPYVRPLPPVRWFMQPPRVRPKPGKSPIRQHISTGHTGLGLLCVVVGPPVSKEGELHTAWHVACGSIVAAVGCSWRGSESHDGRSTRGRSPALASAAMRSCGGAHVLSSSMHTCALCALKALMVEARGGEARSATMRRGSRIEQLPAHVCCVYVTL